MKTLMTLLSLAFALEATAKSIPKIPDAKAAQKQTEDWIAALPATGLVMSYTTTKGGFTRPCYTKPIGADCPQDKSFYTYTSPLVALALNFNAMISLGSTTEETQKALDSITINKLAPEGLALPGWELTITPATSSIKGGTIDEHKEAHFKATVATTIAYVDGKSTDKKCQTKKAKKKMPEGCTFRVTKEFPLTFTFDIPMPGIVPM